MSVAKTVGLARRLDVAARAVTAILGGYAVTALGVGLLARHLPMARAEAVTAASLASFALYAGVVLAAFAARSTARASAWIGGAAAALASGLWLSIHLGGRV